MNKFIVFVIIYYFCSITYCEKYCNNLKKYYNISRYVYKQGEFKFDERYQFDKKAIMKKYKILKNKIKAILREKKIFYMKICLAAIQSIDSKARLILTNLTEIGIEFSNIMTFLNNTNNSLNTIGQNLYGKKWQVYSGNAVDDASAATATFLFLKGLSSAIE